jgi:hypothetical protein
MLQIPIQPVPSQQVKVVLADQNCQIAIYQKAQGVFVDLNSNGDDISVATLAHNAVPLDPRDYAGFSGNLIFIDTQGLDDPSFEGFNSRWFLIYFTAEEYRLSKILNISPSSLLDLLTTDDLIIIYTEAGDTIIVQHGAL